MDSSTIMAQTYAAGIALFLLLAFLIYSGNDDGGGSGNGKFA